MPAEHTKVFVVSMDSDMTAVRMALLQELWAADVPAAMYTGTNDKLMPQLKKAKGVPLTVIAGGDEHARGEVRIKFDATVPDGVAKDDIVVPRTEFVAKAKELLAQIEAISKK